MYIIHSRQVPPAEASAKIAVLLETIGEGQLREWVERISVPRHFGAEPEQNRATADWLCDVEVAHYPPGCSKYNPIEHRLFCHISRAWQSVVLQSIQVARDLAQRVTTSTGLRLIAEIARHTYKKSQPLQRDFLDNLNIHFHNFLPDLNYTAPLWSS